MTKQNSSKTKCSMLITYTCYDADGVLLEQLDEPAKITIGHGDVLPALEKQLLAMEAGETKSVTLKPSQAFGPVYEDRFLEVPLEMFEQDDVQIGETVEVAEDGEETCPGTIVEINDDCLLVDCNHPLAGKTLTFKLTLISKC